MDLSSYLIYISIGLLTGFLSGMFGIGGGSVRIPLLTLAGMPLLTAFGTNMFAIPFSSGVGAYVQKDNINWKVVRSFTIGAVLGIVLATFLVGIFSSKILAALFFFAAILTIIGLYIKDISPRLYESIKPTALTALSLGFLSNFIIGLRGGSGGTLFPPVLKAMHVEMHQAIATSLFTGFFSSFAALIIYFIRGDIQLLPAFVIAFTGVVGSFLGSKLSIRTESRLLKIGLSIIVFVLACVVVQKEFF
ncbi:MAG: sulfite exporter TauE/SafE family protein [Nanoarchaeota archaeon]|nr:sulfite exporter TauE/SafE family protein [Nanoarchaeota archaeon]